MRNMFEFQQSGYLCDTVIVTDDGQLKAHSAVLAAASPLFKEVLKYDETVKEHAILLPGVKLDIADAIMQFIYTGKATLCCNDYASVNRILKIYEELGISKLLDQSHRYRTVSFVIKTFSVCGKFRTYFCK